MPRLARAALLALTLLGLCAGTASAQSLYKWKDDQGVMHYGDSIPPQYAQKESTTLNKQGVAIGHTAATRSPAEVAADAAAADQQARQKQHDSFLLATYT